MLGKGMNIGWKAMTATDTDDYSVAACFPKVKVIIALFALAFDWSSHAAVVPPDGFFPKPETLHYYFLGTLSDGRQIQLSLNRNDAVTGSVFSLK